MNPRDLDDMIDRIDQVTTEPEPAVQEAPESYGQPVGFEEDDEPAPVGWFQRFARRLRTLRPWA